MFVTVLHVGERFCEVDVLAATYVDCSGGFSTEFMIMPVCEVCTEFHFMEMI